MQRSSPSRGCAAVVWLAALAACGAYAAPLPNELTKEEKRKTFDTVTYEFADLVDAFRKPESRTLFSQRPGKNLDEHVRRVILLLYPERWEGGTVADSTMVVREGHRLEIRTDLLHHEEIVQFFAALRRVADLAVVLPYKLYEVEVKFYEKELEPELQKGAAGGGIATAAQFDGSGDEDVPQSALSKLLAKLPDHAAVVAEGKTKLRDRAAGEAFALRNTFVYRAHAGDAKQEPEKVFEEAHSGVSLDAEVLVSPDRRFVDVKLTEKVCELLRIRQGVEFDLLNGNKVPVEVPQLQETERKTTVRAADGEAIVVPVHYRTKSARDKGRVLLLVVTPEIYIEAEEKVIKEEIEEAKRAMQKR